MARRRVGSGPQPPRLGPPLRQQLAIQPPDCALRPRRWGLPAAGCRRPLMPCRGSVACGMCASERFVALMYRVAPGPSSSAKRGLPRPSMYTTTTIHAQVRRGPSGWTLGGRAGVSQPLGSALRARDGTPLVCYMAPTRGQRDAFATALPPRRTSGSGMLPPGPTTRTPHCAAVPATAFRRDNLRPRLARTSRAPLAHQGGDPPRPWQVGALFGHGSPLRYP